MPGQHKEIIVPDLNYIFTVLAVVAIVGIVFGAVFVRARIKSDEVEVEVDSRKPPKA